MVSKNEVIYVLKILYFVKPRSDTLLYFKNVSSSATIIIPTTFIFIFVEFTSNYILKLGLYLNYILLVPLPDRLILWELQRILNFNKKNFWQEIALYGEFTIRETLLYFGWVAGFTTKQVEEKLEFLINLLQLPPSNRYVKNLR